MINRLLLDSSFLYALNDSNDKYHRVADQFVPEKGSQFIIADVVLTEVTYLLKRNMGVQVVANFLAYLDHVAIQLEPVTKTDIRRARTLILTYADARLDFVDCCLVALAERLNLRQLCTFDRRDFSLVKPTHVDYLELLPNLT